MDAEYYEKDGKQYDRITRILDYFATPGLVDWKLRVGKREANRISKIALNIGTNVDEAIKADVLGQKIPKLKTQEAKNCWEAYLQWKQDYSPALAVADTVFDEGYQTAGTPDLIYWDTDTLIDVKCATSIKENYWLQTEFYARQISPLKFKAILRLDKNLGQYEFKKVPLSDEHWEATVSAIKLYRFYNKPECDAPLTQEV